MRTVTRTFVAGYQTESKSSIFEELVVQLQTIQTTKSKPLFQTMQLKTVVNDELRDLVHQALFERKVVKVTVEVTDETY